MSNEMANLAAETPPDPIIHQNPYASGGYANPVENGTIFSTQELKTAHSGKGWAIFAASQEGDFYAGSHVVSQFHHSSFLAGKPVLSAGEMVVENGYLKLITAKSGHYKPDNLQFYNGVKALHRNMLWLGSAKVRLYKIELSMIFLLLEYIYAYTSYSSYKVWD